MIYNPEIAQQLKNELESAIKSRLQSQGHVASGKGLKSIEVQIKETPQALIIAILGEDYLQWQETGRTAGKFPPVAALEKWVKQKGIASEAKAVKRIAFAIAKNMHRIGMHSRGGRIDMSKRGFISTSLEEKSTVIEQRLFQMFEKNFDLLVTQFIKDTPVKSTIRL
jgi:hypothetical protein